MAAKGESKHVQDKDKISLQQPTSPLNIHRDTFIFSVNQAYEARSKTSGDFESHLRFEPFLEKKWSRPIEASVQELKKSLYKIAEHHFSILPQYKKNELVDLENISWFAHSIAALCADIQELLKHYVGCGLVNIQTVSREDNGIAHHYKVTQTKHISLAIDKFSSYLSTDQNDKFELFPLKEIAQEEFDVSQKYFSEIWSLILFIVTKIFGTYGELFVSYVQWKYLQVQAQEEAVDWNVRPPCGAAYRKQFRELFMEMRNAPEGKKDFGKDKHNHKSKDERSSAFAKSGGSVPYARKFPNTSSASNSSTPNEPQESRLEVAAVAETRAAIETLKKNPLLDDITLSPQNSFLRRKQHEVIADSGFLTESRGDGEERCVCIVRKK